VVCVARVARGVCVCVCGACACEDAHPTCRVCSPSLVLSWARRHVSAILDDPAYEPWFLKFKAGGSLPNGSWHVPNCDDNFKPPKCSVLYHDQVQSPEYPKGDGSCAQPCDCGKNVGGGGSLSCVCMCVCVCARPHFVETSMRAYSKQYPLPCTCPPVCCFVFQPCGEYLWDFRALNVSINGQTLLEWYVNGWMLNANSANGSNPYVDGIFMVRGCN
jgi:hypothetical protein